MNEDLRPKRPDKLSLCLKKERHVLHFACARSADSFARSESILDGRCVVLPGVLKGLRKRLLFHRLVNVSGIVGKYELIVIARIWMEVGDRDFLNPNLMRDNMHDWNHSGHIH